MISMGSYSELLVVWNSMQHFRANRKGHQCSLHRLGVLPCFLLGLQEYPYQRIMCFSGFG